MKDEIIEMESMFVDKESTWFIDIYHNILFELNNTDHKCKFLGKIPSEGYRGFPICIMYNKKIYCLPDRAAYLWIYDLDKNNFSNLELSKSNSELKMGIRCGWIWNELLILYSWIQKRIYIIDTQKQCVKKMYDIEGDEKEKLRVNAEFVNNSIYFLSAESSIIYEYNLLDEKTCVHNMNIDRVFCSLASDGTNFWLGSNYREIYIWNKDSNCLEICSDFPNDFGIYQYIKSTGEFFLDYTNHKFETPIFSDICKVGNRIWMIPFHVNNLLYMNVNEKKMNCFSIPIQMEDNNCLQNELFLEYVRENRYLGVFSFKSNSLYEIDSKNLSLCKVHYEIDNSSFPLLLKLFQEEKKAFHELVNLDKVLFRRALQSNIKLKQENRNIGKIIHDSLLYINHSFPVI